MQFPPGRTHEIYQADPCTPFPRCFCREARQASTAISRNTRQHVNEGYVTFCVFMPAFVSLHFQVGKASLIMRNGDGMVP